MKTVSGTQQVGVRLAPDLLRLVDDVATLRSCDRSEAIRHIIHIGAPFVINSKNINLNRLLMGLEILLVDCLRNAAKSDPGDVDYLIDAATKNVEEHHA